MTYIITGIAGFIGSNLAARLMAKGEKVLGVDHLGRRGSNENLERLRKLGNFSFEKGDVSDPAFIDRVFRSAKDVRAVFHLAGQVAVTTSVVDPRSDFNANALGTFNVLEGVRAHHKNAAVIYSSTNKVYGKMADVKVEERNGRYGYADLPNGVGEDQPLEFHSPYGCSKGAGDQYVVDYARIYGLKTVCFRQSCIYGYNQFGIEDQGWVAWFTIASIMGKPITIYGDGKQVRDVLFVEDLIDAYLAAVERADSVAGEYFNIGGGPANTMSLLELAALLEARMGKKLPLSYSDWRPGDQKVFVCNIDKAKKLLGWSPKIGVKQGVDLLYDWSAKSVDLFRKVLA
ncbi:MAG: GDP-mannose 4,6-dehydratase [Planctomycetes bacterium]|nr:GDP-mannose 4,6-dehydratase [Planctomycetota bacterium]